MSSKPAGPPPPGLTKGAIVTNDTTVRLDSRGRINLAPHGPDSDTYLLFKFDNGTFMLVPAKVMPLEQASRLIVAESMAADDGRCVVCAGTDHYAQDCPRLVATLTGGCRVCASTSHDTTLCPFAPDDDTAGVPRAVDATAVTADDLPPEPEPLRTDPTIPAQRDDEAA